MGPPCNVVIGRGKVEELINIHACVQLEHILQISDNYRNTQVQSRYIYFITYRDLVAKVVYRELEQEEEKGLQLIAEASGSL